MPKKLPLAKAATKPAHGVTPLLAEDQLIRQELAALRAEDKLTPDLVFRDPYVLDFLGLKDTYAEKSGIRVSSYWTEMMPREQLQKKLHEAVRLARARLVGREAGRRRQGEATRLVANPAVSAGSARHRRSRR